MAQKLHSILILTAAMFRAMGRNRRLLRLAEEGALAVALVFALRGFVNSGAPYAVYLFCGLAQWFYFRETLLAILDMPAQSVYLFDREGYDPFWYPTAQALAALPTLLLWTGAALLLALVYRLPVTLWQLSYLFPCAVYNAAAQGMFAAAFLPLMRGGAREGVEITMTIFFWTSPVAWPAGEGITGLGLLMFRLNPMYVLCETMRAGMGAGIAPMAWELALFLAATFFVGLAGYLCMRRAWRGAEIWAQEK